MQILVKNSLLLIQISAFANVISSSRYMSLQRIRSDGIGGKGVTFTPSQGVYKNVFIFLHGLGDTADGWASTIAEFGIPETKFILPTAQTIPITINGGATMPGWSDIYGLDSNAPEDKSGFDATSNRINNIIQQELDAGIPASRIVIGGFSQGGAASLHTTLRYPLTLGGCVVLSSWLPFHNDYPAQLSSGASQLPIFQAHGDEDMVVAFKWGLESHKMLKSLIPNPEPQFIKINGMGHGAEMSEINSVELFLKSIFSVQ
eukprot:gene6433-8851_t